MDVKLPCAPGTVLYFSMWFTSMGHGVYHGVVTRVVQYFSVHKDKTLVHVADGAFPICAFGDYIFFTHDEALAHVAKESE